jgi:hypothetical protein
MSRKLHRIPGFVTPEQPDLKAYSWPCGCVTLNSRTGPLERDCGDERCYRREHAGQPPRRVR